MKDLLTIAALGRDGLARILDLAERPDLGRPLAGQGVALVFQKPSARTRNSMEMAVVQLGGHPVYIQKEEVGLGTRETAEDVARTLACYHRIIAARVMDHRDLEAMAAATDTPVLNMLSDRSHPLQALADLLTVRQLTGRIEGARLASDVRCERERAESSARQAGSTRSISREPRVAPLLLADRVRPVANGGGTSLHGRFDLRRHLGAAGRNLTGGPSATRARPGARARRRRRTRPRPRRPTPRR